MKRTAMIFLLIVLLTAAILLIFGLPGCSAPDPTLLNEKVVEMIDRDAAHDPEGAYAMLYPGVTDRETFLSTIEWIYEYFPVTEGYTWELEQWNSTKQLAGGDLVTQNGIYRVEFEGRTFHVVAVWRSDENGSGFTRFQVINEEDWATVQNQ